MTETSDETTGAPAKAPRKATKAAKPAAKAAKPAAGKTAKAAPKAGGSKAAAKPRAPKPAVKLSVVPQAPSPALAQIDPAVQPQATPMTPPEANLVIKKKEFLDRVVAESGAKKPLARDVSEAVLKVLGAALAAGETLALPPLGKLRMTRQIDKQGAEVLLVKIRRAEPGAGEGAGKKTAKAPLAEDED